MSSSPLSLTHTLFLSLSLSQVSSCAGVGRVTAGCWHVGTDSGQRRGKQRRERRTPGGSQSGGPRLHLLPSSSPFVMLAATAVVSILEGTAGGVSYGGVCQVGCRGLAAACVKFLRCWCVRASRASGRRGRRRRSGLYPACLSSNAARRIALRFTIDAPSKRLVVVYADRMPWFGYSAVAAHNPGSLPEFAAPASISHASADRPPSLATARTECSPSCGLCPRPRERERDRRGQRGGETI